MFDYEDKYEGLMDDAARDDFYMEIGEQAIQEFKAERLESFYNQHPEISEPPLRFLAQANELNNHNPTAAFIFAVIAVEVGLKITILKPMFTIRHCFTKTLS